MNPKYDLYDIVTIREGCEQKHLVGLTGAILGMSQDELGLWYYSVHLYNFNESWFLVEEDLKPTGKKAGPEDFGDGTHITVRVDPETGEGKISDYHKPG